MWSCMESILPNGLLHSFSGHLKNISLDWPVDLGDMLSSQLSGMILFWFVESLLGGVEQLDQVGDPQFFMGEGARCLELSVRPFSVKTVITSSCHAWNIGRVICPPLLLGPSCSMFSFSPVLSSFYVSLLSSVSVFISKLVSDGGSMVSSFSSILPISTPLLLDK